MKSNIIKIAIIIAVLLTCLCYVKAQTSCVTYKNISYGWNSVTEHWDEVGTTYDHIKISLYKNDIYVESKNMSHYTTYQLFDSSDEDGVSSKTWKAYDEHNKSLKVIVKYYKGIISYSFMYSDCMYSYYSLL